MAQLVLAKAPTFKAKVGIATAGGEVGDVVFTFKHKSRTELAEFVNVKRVGAGEGSDKEFDPIANMKSVVQRDTDMVMEIAVGWDLPQAFDRDAVLKLIDDFHGAAGAILTAYTDANAGHKAKN